MSNLQKSLVLQGFKRFDRGNFDTTEKLEGERFMKIVFLPFSTPGGKYVYDRETNSILQVLTDEYDAFCRIYENTGDESDITVLQSYQSKGYFPEPVLEHIEHSQSRSLELQLTNKLEKITLQVTQDCNLRCSYCSYSGGYDQRLHSKKVMSYDIIEKSVDFVMKHSVNSKEIDIGFYGGEPLLEIDNIRKAIDYVRVKYPRKEVTFSLTTNGTIFTDEIIEFLFENDFKVSVSLDGPKEVHDMNRVFGNGDGSYDTLMGNMQYIKIKYPDFFSKISFSTVVAPGSDYKCLSDYFNANEVIGDNMMQSSLVSEFGSHEPIKYDDLYHIHYRIQRTKMLLSTLGYIDKSEVSKLLETQIVILKRMYNTLGKLKNIPRNAHPSGTCVIGAMRPFIDTEGILYPCERVSESSECVRIGDVFAGFDIKKARTLLNIGRLTEDECKSCWNFIHCTLCCSSADDGKELSKCTRLDNCTLAKEDTLGQFFTICLLRENGYVFEEDYYNV